jgi:hypothetical protein
MNSNRRQGAIMINTQSGFCIAALTVSFSLAATAPAQTCAWSPVGSGIEGGGVRSLTLADLGSGPALYIGGYLGPTGGDPNARGIIKWDGSAYSALGSGTHDSVWAVAAMGAGSARALYAGGNFLEIGGVAANRVARWDGASWSPLGDGVDNFVFAIAEYNGELYVGGRFATAGGVSASNIAKWNGSTWSALANGGLNWSVSALAVYDDGGGPKLYVGGGFARTADSAVDGLWRIARWDGTSWSAVGFEGLTPWSSEASALTVFNGQLVAGGMLGTIGGESQVMVWNGQYWSSLGGVVRDGGGGAVSALGVVDDGTGPALYAGGTFTSVAGVPANQIAKWDGFSWSALGSGITSAIDELQIVRAIAGFDDGTGSALYVGGSFGDAGGVPGTRLLARWVSCVQDDPCCRGDYNGDGDTGTDADIEAFFACVAGDCCPACPSDADFNCDGDVGTDADIESFFRVLAGGPC